VHRLAREWRPSSLLIEDAGNGTALLQRLRYDEPVGVPSPTGWKPKLDKLARVDAASSMIEAGDLIAACGRPLASYLQGRTSGLSFYAA
jgi:phage terminase large subunit-like protein